MVEDANAKSYTLKMVTEEQIKKQKPVPNGWENLKNTAKNTADLSILKSVPARVRTRMRELKESSSAKNEKIQHGRTARWYTTAPDMFITKLDAVVQNNIGIISYSVYKKDKNGNKEIQEQYAEVPNADGNGMKRITVGATYVIEKDVVETIEYRKPIKVEEFKPDE